MIKSCAIYCQKCPSARTACEKLCGQSGNQTWWLSNYLFALL